LYNNNKKKTKKKKKKKKIKQTLYRPGYALRAPEG